MSKADEIEDKELEEAIKRCRQLARVEHASWIGISNQLAIKAVTEELENVQEENKTQRIQLNSAFGNGFIHKDNIKEVLTEIKLEENSGVYRYDELYSNLYNKIQNLLRRQKNG